jgi:RNA polymerase sigma factor (sigma-70 family)
LTHRSRQDRTFERLYRRHVADVYRYALAVMASPADAEDITQTAFLNAYQGFKRGQRPERPLNWLIAITHNVCRQRFRQAARRPTEVALDRDIADRLIDDEAPRADDIRRGLSQLAFNQRAALVMRELEGRSYAEIAEILGLSHAAVETVIFRARRALREQLEGALACCEAELAISAQLDGNLEPAGKRALRAHLRTCAECRSLARRMRAQRAGLKALTAIPLPGSLAGGWTFGSAGGTAIGAGAGVFGGGVAIKTAMIGAAALIVSGTGYEAVKHTPWRSTARADRVAVIRRHPAGPPTENRLPVAARVSADSGRRSPNVRQHDRVGGRANTTHRSSREPTAPVRAAGAVRAAAAIATDARGVATGGVGAAARTTHAHETHANGRAGEHGERTAAMPPVGRAHVSVPGHAGRPPRPENPPSTVLPAAVPTSHSPPAAAGRHGEAGANTTCSPDAIGPVQPAATSDGQEESDAASADRTAGRCADSTDRAAHGRSVGTGGGGDQVEHGRSGRSH